MDRKSIVQLSRIRQATTKEQVLRLLDVALITALPAQPGNAELRVRQAGASMNL